MGMTLGRNDRCWCGSGKKYKHCHLDRERQTPLTLQDIHERYKATADVRLCVAREIDSRPCRGEIIKAHSLSRSASLERIARDNHVYGFLGSSIPDYFRAGGRPSPRLTGIGKASTFTGFCAGHDNELFRPVDAHPITPTPEQLGLLAYRVLCREIFDKLRAERNTPMIREMDRGKSESLQMITQNNAGSFLEHIHKALRYLISQQKTWHKMILESTYQRLSYMLVRFQSTPEVICSGVFQLHRDFADRVVQDLDQPGSRQDNVAFALIPAEAGGVAFFAWLDEFKEAEEFVQSLIELPEERVASQLVRYSFETFGNVWMSPDWWEALPQPQKDFLIERMFTGNLPYTGDIQNPYSLRDNGMTFVDWEVSEVEKVFHRR